MCLNIQLVSHTHKIETHLYTLFRKIILAFSVNCKRIVQK
jgi:hypothetical protein